jgi:hypothetical protein
MALTNTNLDPTAGASHGNADPVPATSNLLVSLASLPAETLEATLANLALAFRDRPDNQVILVATPGGTHPSASSPTFGDLHLVPYVSSTPASISHFLTAADFLDTFKLAQEHSATACLILGAGSNTLTPEVIRALAAAASSTTTCDLAIPRYQIGPKEGLVNSAILYPVTRALFGSRPRFPLAIDFGLSLPMAERLASAAQRFIAADQNDAILWPVSEAATGNCTITEVDGGTRSMPQPASPDINALLAQIAGSLFADIDAKASFWQRTRPAPALRPQQQEHPVRPSPPDGWPDVTPMLEAFRLAYTNLADIWSLVLPPNSLLGLKRLSAMPPATFRMPDALWARIVYDFILAYRLRTINRGHLLGALAPLYLAWVASHIILADTGTSPEAHIETQAAAFEYDKPYLVSRWRWPDRFNP